MVLTVREPSGQSRASVVDAQRAEGHLDYPLFNIETRETKLEKKPVIRLRSNIVG